MLLCYVVSNWKTILKRKWTSEERLVRLVTKGAKLYNTNKKTLQDQLYNLYYIKIKIYTYLSDL